MVYKKLIRILIFASCLFFIPPNVLAQSLRVSNIHFRTIDEKIEIFFDLPKNNDSIQIQILFRKKTSPSFRYRPRVVSGDAGKGIFSGPNKKIVWYIKKEPPKIFTGSGFYFKIKAIKIPKREEINRKLSDRKQEIKIVKTHVQIWVPGVAFS